MQVTVEIPKEDIAAAIRMLKYRELCGESAWDFAADPITRIAIQVCAQAQQQARREAQENARPSE